MHKATFVNELGNRISLRVKNVKDIGVTKTGESCMFDAVQLSLIGPTSQSTWTITYHEAVEIQRGLTKFLDKKNRPNDKKCDSSSIQRKT